MSDRIAWADLLRVGLGQLRLSPEQFWSLTPAEFFAMAGLSETPLPRMSRGRMAELLARYPDQNTRETGNDGQS